MEFLRKQIESILGEASRYADKDNTTKKEFILRIKEKIERLFELEERPKAELASYIWNKLDNIQFSVGRPYFESCFTSDEKQNYSHKFSTEHFLPTDNNEIERNPISGQLRINNVIYSPDLPDEQKPKVLEPKETTEEIKDEYTNLLHLISTTASKLQVTIDAIIQRYPENKELVQEGLQPLKEKQKQYAHYYAIISNSKDVMDNRNKWGDFEKIKGKFLMDSGETIAHVSKLMDYSSKFGSIGILNNTELNDKVQQLALCPSCNVNIYYTMNEQLKELEIKAQFEI